MAADRDQAEQIRFELDYWLAALNEVRTLNDLVAATASELMRAPIDLLELMLAPTLSDTSRDTAARLSGTVGDALRSLHDMQAPLQTLIDLAGGRLLALRALTCGLRGDEGEQS